MPFNPRIPLAESGTYTPCFLKKGRSVAMTVLTNKDKSLTKSKRASAPEVTKKGSLTVEAAFGIPLFLFAALCLIWLIEIQSIRLSLINAAQGAAKSASESTAVLPVLNTGKLKSDIVSMIGAERIDRSIIKGGSSGISCSGSYLSLDTGEINMKVSCQIELPLPLFEKPSVKLKEEFRLSSWRGYTKETGDGSGGQDSDIVYVTDNGSVWHEDYQCSYLQLSIRYVPYSGLSGIRNESGGRYYPCEKCVFGSAMAGVYITEDGGKYHNSLSCSGLKRTIHAVHRSDISGLGGCSRCSGQE